MGSSLALIGTVALVQLLGVMSPGPDFVMAVRNSVIYSRRTGIYTALGFSFGILVHLFYCVAGLALIISQSIVVFSLIKLFGAGYLIFIGVKSFLSKSSHVHLGTMKKQNDLTPLQAIRSGFLTNVLNPKASLFFLGMFTLVISPETPMSLMITLSAIIFSITFCWFALVAVFFTQKRVRSVFERFQNVFNKVFGVLLVALGIKVALATQE